MSRSFLNMTWIPQAAAAGEELQNRLGQKHLHLPICYSEEEIDANFRTLAEALELPLSDFARERKLARQALDGALQIIGDTPVFIDYTATPRVLSLARRLLDVGFNVTQIFADIFIPGDRADFEYLQKNFPHLQITPTLHVKMRFANEGAHRNDTLAVGQKAAFFTGSTRFADLVWGRGFYGHSGVRAIAELLVDAFKEPKDIRKVISHKGWGCESCL